MRRGFTHWVARGALVLPMLWVFPASGSSQSVSCNLSAEDTGSFVGSCKFATATRRIELSRPADASDALWVGTVEDAIGSTPVEIATYQYSSAPRLIVRTGLWHVLGELSVSEEGLRLAWDEGIEAPPSQT
ncbi:MAG: hypothetical protein OTJ97_10150, partial [SAR202 cluster bacterium]|nr:hypothetical protein [SAR202 cluster bacterium]